MPIASLSRKLGTVAAVGLTALTLASCAPVVATRGNLVPDERLAQIEPGVSTKDEVAVALGSPTTVATFDDDTWYYIGQRTQKRAFFDPKTVDRRVIEITFDDGGVVETVEEVGLDGAREVELVERETPTLGRQITFLEQMLGNFGRGLGKEGTLGQRGRLPN